MFSVSQCLAGRSRWNTKRWDLPCVLLCHFLVYPRHASRKCHPWWVLTRDRTTGHYPIFFWHCRKVRQKSLSTFNACANWASLANLDGGIKKLPLLQPPAVCCCIGCMWTKPSGLNWLKPTPSVMQREVTAVWHHTQLAQMESSAHIASSLKLLKVKQQTTWNRFIWKGVTSVAFKWTCIFHSTFRITFWNGTFQARLLGSSPRLAEPAFTSKFFPILSKNMRFHFNDIGKINESMAERVVQDPLQSVYDET